MTDRTTGVWFTSSYSSNNAQCVEVRFVGGGTDVRDSKHHTGPVLSFTNADWYPFIDTLRTGTFDR